MRCVRRRRSTGARKPQIGGGNRIIAEPTAFSGRWGCGCNASFCASVYAGTVVDTSDSKTEGRVPETDFEAAAYAHVEEAAQSIAQIHAAHHQSASLQQRRIDSFTELLGKSWFIGALGFLMVIWVALNSLAASFGFAPIDPPPFPGLSAVTSLASICIMLLVLGTQRRENELAEKREQLTLELAVLSANRPRSLTYWKSFDAICRLFRIGWTNKHRRWRNRPIRRKCWRSSPKLTNRQSRQNRPVEKSLDRSGFRQPLRACVA